jgi:ATP-dependent DNA helicase RecQ
MTPEIILKKYWDYDTFRPGQREIIQSVLDGKDTLALLPTGGGKSICFQIPALCKDGICLVISPLIALMRDQVNNLLQRGIPAAAIYSGMSYRTIDRILDNAVFGNYKFLYMSPERLTTEIAQVRIKRMNINLLAIDEAHCVSQWGYDFRPSYLEIANIRAALKNIPILGLTATATTEVIEDIQKKLEFRRNSQVFKQDFSRPNLSYVVRHAEHKETKMLEIVQKVPGSGIIYTRNRRRTKEIADFLTKNGILADYYHAGLTPDERSIKQDAWVNNKIRIMAATNAFGMGIDKPDVRTVVHIDLPNSPEAYFQEAGRGGRDGKKSYAVLLYDKNDAIGLERQLENDFPEMKEIRRVYAAVGNYLQMPVGSGLGESFDFELVTFCEKYGFDVLKAYSCFKILEQDGWLSLSESVYELSTLKILLERQQLYDYQLRTGGTVDKILKSLLRIHQGITTNYCSINEYKLAGFIKMPVEAIEKALLHLHKDGIVDYRRKKDKPQLTFVRERADQNWLTIDWSRYMFRKKRETHRVKKAIEYAEMEICRSRQLLEYFGQEKTTNCGVCDVCLNKQKVVLSASELEILKHKILKLIAHTPLSIREIVDAFAEKDRSRVIQTVQYLGENGFIVAEKDKFIIKNTN